ncbi:hypothetical protein ACOSQ3_007901 [Xanthoceras sorbifolium]
MAGMLPGVGVPHRRRPQQQLHRQETSIGNSDISLRERREPSIMAAMDETALRARLRLEQRLAYLHSSSRSSDRLQDGGNGPKRKAARVKDSRSGTKFLRMPWNFQLNKCKSIKTCSVCLEDLQEQQRVMNLSCCHKYHSHCLLPWLVAHPSCPNCRTPVQY